MSNVTDRRGKIVNWAPGIITGAYRFGAARFPVTVLDSAESEQFKNAAIDRDLIYDRRMWLWDYSSSGFTVKEYSPQRHGVRRVRSIFNQELFSLRPQRLCGVISDCCFTANWHRVGAVTHTEA